QQRTGQRPADLKFGPGAVEEAARTRDFRLASRQDLLLLPRTVKRRSGDPGADSLHVVFLPQNPFWKRVRSLQIHLLFSAARSTEVGKCLVPHGSGERKAYLLQSR